MRLYLLTYLADPPLFVTREVVAAESSRLAVSQATRKPALVHPIIYAERIPRRWEDLPPDELAARLAQRRSRCVVAIAVSVTIAVILYVIASV